MKSARNGNITSDNDGEVTDILQHGFKLVLEGQEVFMNFEQFPWFKGASDKDICNVSVPSAGHFYWPTLDVDLDADSIRHPENYPLVSRS